MSLGAGFTRVPYALPPGVVFPPEGLTSGDPLGLTGAIAGDIDQDGDPEILMGAVSSYGQEHGPLAWTYRRATGEMEPFALPDVQVLMGTSIRARMLKTA